MTSRCHTRRLWSTPLGTLAFLTVLVAQHGLDISGTWQFDPVRSDKTAGVRFLAGGSAPFVVKQSSRELTTTRGAETHVYPFGSQEQVEPGRFGVERRSAKFQGTTIVLLTRYPEDPGGPSEQRSTWTMPDPDTLVQALVLRSGESLKIVYSRKK